MTIARSSDQAVMDSTAVAERVSSGGTLGFYMDTLRKNPRKIAVGLRDTIAESGRFAFAPRFPVNLGVADEIKIPGATTVLETIWLCYGASRSSHSSPEWVEVGCFKGLSTARLSLLCRHWNRRLFACDTFEGLPGSDTVYDAVDGGVAIQIRELRGVNRGSSWERDRAWGCLANKHR
jgi:hypothetical protein